MFKGLRYHRRHFVNSNKMVLLIDIGNSTVVVAVSDQNGNISRTWRFKTLKEQTMAYFRHELYTGSKKYQIQFCDVKDVVMSSVVPEVNDDVAQAISDLTGVQAKRFTFKEASRYITIDVESPSQLGNDRLAAAVGVVTHYDAPAIIIDMGTATTVGVIDRDCRFIGGMIIPGVKTSLNALSARASQLPSINIEKPRHIIGRNTLESMQSGSLYGTAAMIDGIIDRILMQKGEILTNDKGQMPLVIATGGMAKTIIPHCRHDIIIDELLIFKGLQTQTDMLPNELAPANVPIYKMN